MESMSWAIFASEKLRHRLGMTFKYEITELNGFGESLMMHLRPVPGLLQKIESICGFVMVNNLQKSWIALRNRMMCGHF